MSVRNLISLSIRPSEILVSAGYVSEIPGWKHYSSFLQGPDLHSSEAAWKCTDVSNNHKQIFLPVPPQKVRNCTDIQFLLQGVAIYDSGLAGFGLQSSSKMSTEHSWAPQEEQQPKKSCNRVISDLLCWESKLKSNVIDKHLCLNTSATQRLKADFKCRGCTTPKVPQVQFPTKMWTNNHSVCAVF